MSTWDEVKARKREQEIRRLALELDPFVTNDGDKLSTIVNEEGWEEAESFYAGVRRFMDRLGAMVAERDDMATRYKAALESCETVLAKANEEIKRLKGVAHGFVDDITERDYKILMLEARIEKALMALNKAAQEYAPRTFGEHLDKIRAALTGAGGGVNDGTRCTPSDILERAWRIIAGVRDAYPRAKDDADTWDIVDALADAGLLVGESDPRDVVAEHYHAAWYGEQARPDLGAAGSYVVDRARLLADLRILADRDDVTTGDIHQLADDIESGEYAACSVGESDPGEPEYPAPRSGNQFPEPLSKAEAIGMLGGADHIRSELDSLRRGLADAEAGRVRPLPWVTEGVDWRSDYTAEEADEMARITTERLAALDQMRSSWRSRCGGK